MSKPQIVNPFWGQNMNLVFQWLGDQDIAYVGLLPSQFRELMEDLTGTEGTGYLTPEEAANQWLLAIAEQERND